jgi:hypothetical protein
MVEGESPFLHHLLEISIAECVPQIPTHAEYNDLGLEVTPFEGVLRCHNWPSFSSFLTILTDQLSFCNTALLNDTHAHISFT